jgi:cytochrome c oxidase subunit 4
MSEHVASRKGYIVIFLALLALTAVTATVAFVNLGILNPVVALGIATIKALLVALFFMHVKDTSERMIKVVILSGLFFLILLLTLTLADYATRLWH